MTAETARMIIRTASGRVHKSDRMTAAELTELRPHIRAVLETANGDGQVGVKIRGNWTSFNIAHVESVTFVGAE